MSIRNRIASISAVALSVLNSFVPLSAASPSSDFGTYPAASWTVYQDSVEHGQVSEGQDFTAIRSPSVSSRCVLQYMYCLL